MKAFVVFATVLAAASANPQVLLNNGLYGLHHGGAIQYANQIISAPAVSYAVPSVTKTQYHAQDELGQASYGYAHPGQAHAAVRDAAGNVRGSYAYINPEGKEVRVEYVADGGGFRVASNALPVSPVHPVAVPQVAQLVGPAPVQDTPEVVQARAAHAVAHQEALARSGRKKRGIVTSSVLPSTLGYSSVIGHPVNSLGYSSVIGHPVNTLGYSSVIGHPVNTLGYSSVVGQQVGYSAVGAVASPVAVSVAQPVREATLTKVVNNPGHAVSYRVD